MLDLPIKLTNKYINRISKAVNTLSIDSRKGTLNTRRTKGTMATRGTRGRNRERRNALVVNTDLRLEHSVDSKKNISGKIVQQGNEVIKEKKKTL